MRAIPVRPITRVELIVGLAGMDLPAWAVRKLIASCINLVIQASRLPGGKRKITSITEITGMEGDTIAMHEIFSFVQTGMNSASRRGRLPLGDGDPSQSPEQAEGEGCGLAARIVRRAAFSVADQPGTSPMTPEPESPAPDQLRSALHTQHPQIADEIEGAIKTLHKLKEFAASRRESRFDPRPERSGPGDHCNDQRPGSVDLAIGCGRHASACRHSGRVVRRRRNPCS